MNHWTDNVAEALGFDGERLEETQLRTAEEIHNEIFRQHKRMLAQMRELERLIQPLERRLARAMVGRGSHDKETAAKIARAVVLDLRTARTNTADAIKRLYKLVSAGG